jgi:hypothetical protein
MHSTAQHDAILVSQKLPVKAGVQKAQSVMFAMSDHLGHVNNSGRVELPQLGLIVHDLLKHVTQRVGLHSDTEDMATK